VFFHIYLWRHNCKVCGVPLERFPCECIRILYDTNSCDGIVAQMGPDEDGLVFSITDNAYASISFEFGDVILEF
jgi:hypothetical protein